MGKEYNTARHYYSRSRQFESAQNVLRKALRRYGLDSHLARYEFVLHWEEIVGPEIAKRATPEAVRKRCLIVRVCDSAWMQELSFRKSVILHRLQNHVDDKSLVQDIRFYVEGRRR